MYTTQSPTTADKMAHVRAAGRIMLERKRADRAREVASIRELDAYSAVGLERGVR